MNDHSYRLVATLVLSGDREDGFIGEFEHEVTEDFEAEDDVQAMSYAGDIRAELVCGESEDYPNAVIVDIVDWVVERQGKDGSLWYPIIEGLESEG